MSHINPMTSNNKFNSSGNDHPENQGDFQSNNPNVPNSYFELLAMQGGVNTKTKNINEIHELPELIPVIENCLNLIARTKEKSIHKLNENMQLLDELKIIESKRFQKIRHINSHLIDEEIHELMKDQHYLDKLIQLLDMSDCNLHRFIPQLIDIEKVLKNLNTEI